MLFRELLRPEYVRIGLKATKKNEIFEELAHLFEEIHGIDYKEAYKAMIERERKGSTGLGNGLAIPHGRSANVDDVHLIFVYEPEGRDFEAYDKQPSNLFLAVLTSDEYSPQQQLEILRIIVEIYEKTDIVQALKQVKTPQDLFNLILQKEAECHK
jgi:mannitol/fructose-specific phosphotransferase system IIA component (Ntr-type)